MKRFHAWLVFLLAAGCLPTQPSISTPNLNAPRSIEALDTVFLEEMTWMEVRDALRAGKTTVLVPTGGLEQSGPYLATGKHNYILRATTEAIARKLGDALVAPIVPFVPEGNIDPPSGHMKYPGTISISEETYERLLTDICSSLRKHGFRHLILLGDSEDNQLGMKAVANRLDAKLANGEARLHFIAEYYDNSMVDQWLEKHGIRQQDEGLHDDFATTAQLMVVDPAIVRTKQRLAVGKFRINGIELTPAETVEWGKQIINLRAETTIRAIRKAVPEQGKP
jgi:creatinine amidohydrolase/Fe(II)-dependent formamide hydrolase-like protein